MMSTLLNSSYKVHHKNENNFQQLDERVFISSLACEQALIFVIIKDVARAAKPRVTSRRAQRAGERSGTRNEISRARPLAGSLRSPTRNSRLRRSCHIFYNNDYESLLAGYFFLTFDYAILYIFSVKCLTFLGKF